MADLTIKKFLDSAGVTHLWQTIETELNKKVNRTELSNVATTGAATDVTITDTGNYFKATTVEGALQEIGNNIQTAGAVSMTESSPESGNVLKVYTLSQNGKTIGTINIPKDLVATAGAIVNEDGEGNSGTFLRLTIDNSDPIYINVASLVEYNGVANSDELTFTDTNHQISATINVGSIAKSKLSTEVQTALTAASNALQTSDIAEGATNGTISIKGTDVAVHGLGTAAYTNSTAYDVAGSADAVYAAIIALTNPEIDAAIAAANATEP